MSGLFGVLDVAGRGLLVAQQSIRVTSHNIANVNTPGYSRQRNVVQPATATQTATGSLGNGAESLSIEQIRDAFVERQLLSQGAAEASTDAQARSLTLVEEILNEQAGAGIGSALSKLYDAFSQLAATNTPAAREALRSDAQGLIDTLARVDGQLRDLQGSVDTSIGVVLEGVNELSARIAELNGEIIAREAQGPANDLRDQRDQLLRDLAGKVEVTSFEEANGSIVVLLGSGQPLVEGVHAQALSPIPDPGNPFSPLFARVGFGAGSAPLDITDDIGGGELGGLLRARDTILPAAIRSVDSIAYNLADTVNGVHNAGVGLDGVSGDFFAPLTAVEDAARNLSLSARVTTSSDAIAVGLTTAAGDNRNAQDLAALRNQAAPIFLPGDPPGPASGPSRSLLDHTAAVVADIGQQSRDLQAAREQQARVGEILQNRRDEVSGVSLDEEVTRLVELQAAFQANARIVQAVDRLIEGVLEMI